ncbi:AAA family ATPase [Macellibacteroides fermentans]|uniref:AAA family ATPase n=1 Tax=Macellibacteroides fermentans TaxID=879969 RepID=UPI003B93B92B
MRILAIRGRNLASLEGDFSIDFTAEPLASAGIYSISGPTGSGKSTLLDTMCLALFGRTPRTDQARENEVKLRDVSENTLGQGDPRNLLRRGSVSGYAEVDFVALDGYGYRARWSVRRARDKASGALQKVQHSLTGLPSLKEEQGTSSELLKRISELIGLTFEQFTRSVLLAQNDFATFLKADQGEKASLLEKLTGTERYSAISRLIYEKHAAAKQVYEQLMARLQGVALLTDQEREELDAQLVQTGRSLALLEDQKNAIKLRLDWFTQRDQLLVEKTKAEADELRARTVCEQNVPRKDYLALVDGVQGARSLYDAVVSAGRTLTDKESHCKRLAQDTTLATEGKELLEKESDSINKRYLEETEQFRLLGPDLKKARQLDIQLAESVRTLKESENSFQELTAYYDKEQDKLTKLSLLCTKTTDSIAALEMWRTRYLAKASIAEQLPLLENYLDRAFSAHENLNRSQQTIASLRDTERKQREESGIKKELHAKQLELFCTASQRLEVAQKEQKGVSIDAVQQESKMLRARKELLQHASQCWKSLGDTRRSQGLLVNEIAKITALLEMNEGKQFETALRLDMALHLRQQAKQTYEQAFMAATKDIELLRSKLTEGAPCPLCGSEHHPYAGEDDRLKQTLAKVEEASVAASTNYDACWKQCETLKQEAVSLNEKIDQLNKSLQELDTEESRLKAEWLPMEETLKGIYPDMPSSADEDQMTLSLQRESLLLPTEADRKLFPSEEEKTFLHSGQEWLPLNAKESQTSLFADEDETSRHKLGKEAYRLESESLSLEEKLRISSLDMLSSADKDEMPFSLQGKSLLLPVEADRISLPTEGELLSVAQSGLPVSVMIEWFTEQVIICDDRLKVLEELALTYSNLQKELQLLQEDKLRLNSLVGQLDKELTELTGQFTLTQSRIVAEEAACAEQSRLLQESLLKADELFGHDQWQAAWREDTVGFRDKLRSFAVEWQDNKVRLQQEQDNLTRQKAEREGAVNLLDTIGKQLVAARELVAVRKNAWETIRDSRLLVLDGKDVDATEQQMLNALESLKKELDEMGEKLKKQLQLETELKATYKQLEADVKEYQSRLAQTKQTLQQWLADFNATRSKSVDEQNVSSTKPTNEYNALFTQLGDELNVLPTQQANELNTLGTEAEAGCNEYQKMLVDEALLAALLVRDTQWIASERNFLQQQENDRITARTTLDDRVRRLAEHDAKRKEMDWDEASYPAEPEVLQHMQVQCAEKSRELDALATEIRFKLRTNEENRQKVQSLEKELLQAREVSENWASLNEIAGSSDGGKFRRIAQGYTLDVLLSYANVQLSELSKRYRLERVPDTLALQVIDRDMCDEVRTVHSLSGGESFLVSLALALGLSSLSSNRMRVESLFIDEGFGSLDAETLRVAMDALDSLRTRGRKIGVISHVQEMTERIPVQIKVNRGDNGRSYLTVEG